MPGEEILHAVQQGDASIGPLVHQFLVRVFLFGPGQVQVSFHSAREIGSTPSSIRRRRSWRSKPREDA